MLNRETFEHRYRQLVYITREKGSEPSFASGFWFDEEGFEVAVSEAFKLSRENNNRTGICGLLKNSQWLAGQRQGFTKANFR